MVAAVTASTTTLNSTLGTLAFNQGQQTTLLLQIRDAITNPAGTSVFRDPLGLSVFIDGTRNESVFKDNSRRSVFKIYDTTSSLSAFLSDGSLSAASIGYDTHYIAGIMAYFDLALIPEIDGTQSVQVTLV